MFIKDKLPDGISLEDDTLKIYPRSFSDMMERILVRDVRFLSDKIVIYIEPNL